MKILDGADCNTQEYLLIKTCLQQVLESLEHMPGRNSCLHVAIFPLSLFFLPFGALHFCALPPCPLNIQFVCLDLTRHCLSCLIYRDDPEFEGIRERAMQRIVSGEVDKSTGRLIDWSKALALEMELSKKPQVTSCHLKKGFHSRTSK